MLHYLRGTIASLLAAGVLLLPLSAAVAGTPLYELPAELPAVPAYVRPVEVEAAAGVDLAPAPSYAYGWFGVPPRRHLSRHFGYYRNYTQWTVR